MAFREQAPQEEGYASALGPQIPSAAGRELKDSRHCPQVPALAQDMPGRQTPHPAHSLLSSQRKGWRRGIGTAGGQGAGGEAFSSEKRGAATAQAQTLTATR